MKRMMRQGIILVVSVLSWVSAQPVFEATVPEALEVALPRLEAALAEDGHEVYRTLNITQSIEARGDDFMLLRLVLLNPDPATQAALAENPRWAAILPFVLAVYQPTEGQTRIVLADISQYAALLPLSEKAYQALLVQLYDLWAILEMLGDVRPGEPVTLASLPYRLADYGEDALDDAIFLFESIYQTNNMNHVASFELANLQQHWFCNTPFAQAMFGVEPRFAVNAPCRIFAFSEGGQTWLGALNAVFIREAFPLTRTQDTTLADIERVMLETFEQLGIEVAP